MTLKSASLHAALLVTALTVACGSDDGTPSSSGSSTGGSTTTGTGSGAGGAATLPEPDDHRPAPEMCTGEPPAGNAIPDPEGECDVDSDCTEGTNGRCIWPYGGSNICQYDECFADEDCGGASICACRVSETFGFNRCFQGNCIVDADCAGGWCSPSAVHLGPTCMEGISPGSVGFFCRTAEDECLDDDDCGGQGTGACLFSVDALHWVCQDLLCTN